MTNQVVHRFANASSVAENAAATLISELTRLLSIQDSVHLVLTGGTVGISTLAAVNANQNKADVDFKRVHLWWGDERYLASDSPDRNAFQAKNALLKNLDLNEQNVHEFPAADSGLSLEQAAKLFAKHVMDSSPKFDIVLLGMGPDGHIASLFPGKPQPKSGEWIIAEHDSPKPPAERLSFTYEALNTADQIWFVVAGADKQNAVEIAMGDNPETLPVGNVHGRVSTQWFIDSTAGTKVFGC